MCPLRYRSLPSLCFLVELPFAVSALMSWTAEFPFTKNTHLSSTRRPPIPRPNKSPPSLKSSRRAKISRGPRLQLKLVIFERLQGWSVCQSRRNPGRCLTSNILAAAHVSEGKLRGTSYSPGEFPANGPELLIAFGASTAFFIIVNNSFAVCYLSRAILFRHSPFQLR